MMQALLSAVIFIPISFFSYVMSERVNATHQSRVGKGIHFFSFFKQHSLDAFFQMKGFRSKSLLLILCFQYSGLFIFNLHFQSVLLIYLAMNLVILVLVNLYQASENHEVQLISKRIEFDRIQIQAIFSSLLAFISSYACDSISGISGNFGTVHSLLVLPFIGFFQIAGMILYGEYPFIYFNERKGWLSSARFYLWCLLSAKLFLGDGLWVLDLYLKATLLFVGFRLVAIYFPLYRQKDLLRIGLLYLIPLSLVLWLLVMVTHGLLSAEAVNG